MFAPGRGHFWVFLQKKKRTQILFSGRESDACVVGGWGWTSSVLSQHPPNTHTCMHAEPTHGTIFRHCRTPHPVLHPPPHSSHTHMLPQGWRAIHQDLFCFFPYFFIISPQEFGFGNTRVEGKGAMKEDRLAKTHMFLFLISLCRFVSFTRLPFSHLSSLELHLSVPPFLSFLSCVSWHPPPSSPPPPRSSSSVDRFCPCASWLITIHDRCTLILQNEVFQLFKDTLLSHLARR